MSKYTTTQIHTTIKDISVCISSDLFKLIRYDGDGKLVIILKITDISFDKLKSMIFDVTISIVVILM